MVIIQESETEFLEQRRSKIGVLEREKPNS